ncbi:hypothetical protein HG535_0B05430 [Zygotorulaspora mrakii]|uniref:Arrestin C-terminal-like domain-containing protein n=1 Tax=Zygotorulaspora mrakii TaxID=42260 RepID=A0A7H9AYV7_ZYGMR|nr:uncharacterized protein HG535_0B05430 [Zygotorulaspora mrakii]QLG71501.1 hypothetical protein HG535_0B05430 [Zygotorulaspora mrakii]
MPYSIPRPIPAKHSAYQSGSRERDRDNQSHSQAMNSKSSAVGSAPVHFSPTKRAQTFVQSQQQGMGRRRSSTIKSALSSLLGSSPPQQQQQHVPQNVHRSFSLPKTGSSLSVGAENPPSHANSSVLSPGLRRYSTTSAEVTSDGHRNSGYYTTNEEDEDAVTESVHGDTSLDEDSTIGESTSASGSSASNPGVLSKSLKSLGKIYLTEYLAERGLLAPTTVMENQSLKVSLATSGESVFLPTMSSNDDEYLARLNGLREDEDEGEDEDEDEDEDEVDDLGFEAATSESRPQPHVRSPGSSDRGNRTTAVNATARSTSERAGVSEPVDESVSTSSIGSTLEIDSSMATYTIAMILSVSHPITLSNLRTELCSRIRVYWPNGVPPTKVFHEEFYCAGHLDWDLSMDNVNLFVPANVSSSEKIINNCKNLKPMEIFQNSNDSRKRYLDKNNAKKQMMNKIKSSKNQLYQSGDYVFIIPIVFSNTIPESLYLPSARVNYRFRIGMKLIEPYNQQNKNPDNQESLSAKNPESDATSLKKLNLFKKLKNNLHLNNPHVGKEELDDNNNLYAEYPVNIVRTPPQYSISTANKPVYINRVWSDSLSYEISFAQKYVSLDSKVPIKIKIVPLVKNICLKRIRISVLEKITLVSKDCEYEYDQIDPVAKDPYNPYFAEFSSKRKKERNLSILEIRSKEKGSRALREEVVNNCIDDNLLAYNCLQDDKGEKGLGMTEPLVITTNLEFPKYIDMDKDTARVVPPYGIDVYSPVSNPELAKNSNTANRGGVIGFLAGRRSSLSATAGTKNTGQNHQYLSTPSPVFNPKFHETSFQSDSEVPVEFQTRLNEARRGLYLDSLHFSNIYSRHKLEIMLRISKPDAKDPARLRHYEVLIDTPIFLVSDLCNSGNMELPTYDMATSDRFSPEMIAGAAPPTFEEAISIPGSPLNSPMNSPVGSPILRGSFEQDDLYMNNINLSRSASIGGMLPLEGMTQGSTPVPLSTSVDANQRYNNLDGLLSPTFAAEVSDISSQSRSNTKNAIGEHQNNYMPTYGRQSVFKDNYSIARESPASGSSQTKQNIESNNDNVHPSDVNRADVTHYPPRYDDIVSMTSGKH